MKFLAASRRLRGAGAALVWGGLLLGLLSSVAYGAPSEWMTDYPAALREAKAQSKLVLVFFTASDACPSCLKLQREVFADLEFQQYAKDHLILLEVDIPLRHPQPEPLSQQNKKLAAQYHVEGFPRIVLLDSEGEPISFFGYLPGGTKAFLNKIEQLRRQSTAGG